MLRFALDTNAISRLSAEMSAPLIALLSRPKLQVVLPDFIHEEVGRGNPGNEQVFLDAIGAEIIAPPPEHRAIRDLAYGMLASVSSDLIGSESSEGRFSKLLDENGFGARKLNNLRPPGIIQQIENMIGANADVVNERLSLRVQSDDAYTKVAYAAMLLPIFGFQKDSASAKSDDAVRLSAWSRQLNDSALIGYAADCDALLSCDARLCKIAYAVYEDFGVSTTVYHLRRDTWQKVSAETWASIA